MSSALDTKEREFALKVRRALDDHVAQLPDAVTGRLALARGAALARKKPEPAAQTGFVPVFALAGGASLPSGKRKRAGNVWLHQFSLLLPLAALVVTLFGVAHWENQKRVAEVADIDAAMLSDELPLDAYLDHGFHAYLSRSR